ncbi:hypothetical protein AtNW77_Chr5g0110561 [Arabidopsis thaliana]
MGLKDYHGLRLIWASKLGLFEPYLVEIQSFSDWKLDHCNQRSYCCFANSETDPYVG